MKRHTVCLLISFWLMATGGHVAAYDLVTHAKLTETAFDASARLAMYFQDLGITASDIFDPDRSLHDPELSAEDSVAFARFKNDGTPRGWLAAGAIREDDFRQHPLLTGLGCPQPENPQSDIDRPKHHFFDIQRGGAGITLAGGISAPDWALGLQGRGQATTQNQFSLPNARAYQFRSLTESSREERERNTARLFRTLGQVTHVLQDMAQPQHTRNDPHLGCTNALAQFFGGEKSWYEAYTETRALNMPYRSRSDASRPLGLSGYGPVGFQTYRDYWANASGSGLAEFSSRNFFSAGTNLGTFYLAGPCGGLSQPVCDPQPYRTEDLDFSIPTITGEPLTGRVRFFLRDIADPLTGQVIQNVRASSRSLWDQHLEANQRQPKFSLNTYNYDSIANVLLPRAVGYSAGLLNYFFRGKLDVDVVEDATDPAAVRLSGTNASPEKLDGGSLTLYADDAYGVRSPAVALGPVDVTDVAPGQVLSSARFQAPENAERFVAVYQGTLGGEVKPSEPTLPGAVIGKVLGGVRVEEIFSDGTRWKLRTPRGVYLLPLTTSEFQEVKWGDADNLLLARTLFGRSQPNRFVVYEVRRESNSAELLTIPAPDGLTVEVRKIRETVFPFGMPLGITVQLTWRLHYRQFLGRYTRTVISRWTPYDPSWPENGWYKSEAPQLGPLTIETARDETVPFDLSFDLLLDLDHNSNSGWQPGEGYTWRLDEVAVDTAGRVLAVVLVSLRNIQSLQADFPHFRVNPQGVTEIAWYSHVYPPLAYGSTVAWVLVDISEPGVPHIVASTADPRTTLAYQGRSDSFEGVWVHAIQSYEGGPNPGSYDQGWSQVSLGNPNPLHPLVSLAEVPLEHGVQAVSLDGHLKQEFRAALGPQYSLDFQLGRTQSSYEQVYDCVSETACSGIRFLRSDTDIAAIPVSLWRGVRARPAPGTERLVFLGYDQSLGQAGVLVWDPSRSPARVVAQVRGDWLFLGAATPARALLLSYDYSTHSSSSTLISLEGAQDAATFPNVDLTRSFTLLQPDSLYNTRDGKFYLLQPPLRRMALPAKLADVTGNPVGDYHAIRLP